MAESIRVRIEEGSQTSDARRSARIMAHDMGFNETLTEQVAIVVTEACTNLLKHAGGGEVLIRSTGDDSGDTAALELLALDKGPGISNLDQCLRDGFSTGGTPGHGLGAIVRLSGSTDFYCAAGRGVALLARWTVPGWKAVAPAQAKLRIGAVNVPKPGQEVCGDSWGSVQTENSCTILLADGLGHGLEARTASAEAVRILHASSPGASAAELVERAHQGLRSTRGAALAVAKIDRDRGTLQFSGIGNIAAHIYSGTAAGQHLVSVHGTAGFQTARIREFQYPWPERPMLLMYSDGLGSQTGVEQYPGLALRDPSLIAGVLYRDFARGNDDATAVVVKEA